MMALTCSSAWWRSDEGLLAWYLVDRETWVLETVFLVLVVSTLAVIYARFRFSRGAALVFGAGPC